jgi:hypothetical protein
MVAPHESRGSPEGLISDGRRTRVVTIMILDQSSSAAQLRSLMCNCICQVHYARTEVSGFADSRRHDEAAKIGSQHRRSDDNVQRKRPTLLMPTPAILPVFGVCV